jgi:squalene-hopene/tetraprenyl-beta-curcumene cyclase
MLKPAQDVRSTGPRRTESGPARDAGSAPDVTAVDRVVDDVRDRLTERQQDDGHWVFELEADATIPAEYILYKAFLAEPVEPELEAKIGAYLRRIQGDHGGWPLFHAGDFDMSASVKAYYALKMIGDATDAAHMARARAAILDHGGAETSNVFTRILLALFGQVPWRAVPVMPVEIMLLPRWFPFHMSKVSYWSRTVIAPLLVLMAEKPQAKNPKGIGIAELFAAPPEKVKTYHTNPTGSVWGAMLLRLDTLLRVVEPRLPKRARRRAIDKAMAFTRERLNGEDGLGAIFPAMVNAVEAMVIQGVPEDDPDLATAKRAIEKLLVVKEDEAYCQPCVSPVWDTGLATHAMLEAGIDREDPKIKAAADWLLDREITDVKGDWTVQAPDLKPGGWAFQYRNDHYPDVDDTAVVGMALHRLDDPKYAPAVERAAEWILGMQSKNGGWGAFDIDNDKYYLNHIPFADHGALLDPPTADVSARCLSFLCQIGYDRDHPAVARAIDYLKREQEEDGSWFGRWGTNYIYGTWSVLCALNAAGEDMDQPYIRRAVDWLKAQQNEDGGWGEDGATYWRDRRGENQGSTPSQTAWALMGLMATGDIDDPAVERGVAWLDRAPRDGARWEEDLYTAVGFPRVFYLRYHGYAAYFPLWALARYRNLKRANDRKVAWGM